ncbi:ribokinase [Loktanella sp. SALINAS62]|uniref:ribokinase n=1 Tax=Loktanella sp. SALINAS62 TaxID=2706124 RepID=UPI001B8C757C|nr:ribokinase [Loktanella sp. SALINAS62]MBS1301373.1 ribokinase [Loktanella sp. SALINAS62]
MGNDSAAVVVVGSLHYDIFVEAPHRPAAGETVTGSRWFPKFGGKGGNQAVAVARQGARTSMVSAVGKDGFADFLLDGLSKGGVDTAHIAKADNVGTGMSVAISDASGDYGAVIVSGSNLTIDPQSLSMPELWDGATHLILQNEISEETNLAAAQAARSHGVTVCLNAAPWRGMSDAFLSLVDILIVNALEAEALCGIAVNDLDTAQSAAAALSERFTSVVVTAGGDGVAFASDADRVAIKADKVKVVSTHGAGDCFIGSLVARLAAGDAFGSALGFANQEAARHVSGR